MAEPRELPVKAFASRDAFATWMERNHAKSHGIWMKVAKKGTGIKSITIPEALDVVLCYGWIDGLRQRLDHQYYLQRYTPRRERSNWSKINRHKAEALIESGAMHAAGLAEIERAKADGRWDAALYR